MASCASPSPSSETLQKKKSPVGVLVSNDLMELIKDEEMNGERNVFKKERPYTHSPSSSPLFAHLTTMDELLTHLKNYIIKHQLFDPTNPLKILVHDNELGALLGKSEFSIFDVRNILLERCVFPVTAKNASEVISSISDKNSISKKRKLDENDSEFSAKRINTGVYDSDESMHSYQDYETEFVKDSTSDDNFSLNDLIIAETYDLDVEYEIESDGENSRSCDSDSDFEDLVKNAILTFIAQSTDSDIEYLADCSSDDPESEKELSEEDKWKCHSCGTLNDPVVGCCCACWETRYGWLSERSEREIGRDFSRKNRRRVPRSKRKLPKKRESNKNKDSSNLKTSDLSSVAKESLSNANLSSAPTTESLSLPSTSCNNSSDVIPSKPPSNKHDAVGAEVKPQLCLFCCSKPADSTIIHGKVGCKVCCFSCGKKVFAENERCPVCRRIIERIVYLYSL